MHWWMWYVGIAAALVIAYVGYRVKNRTRRPDGPIDSVQAYERFRQAMAAPVPAARRPWRGSRDRVDS